MKRSKLTDRPPRLDLLETRRQLVAMRSLHSHNRHVAIEINKLILKIAHLHRPDDLAHEKQLIKMIAQTLRTVELVLSQETAAPHETVPNLSRSRNARNRGGGVG
jgi:hypothetical protein